MIVDAVLQSPGWGTKACSGNRLGERPSTARAALADEQGVAEVAVSVVWLVGLPWVWVLVARLQRLVAGPLVSRAIVVVVVAAAVAVAAAAAVVVAVGAEPVR